MCLGVPGRIVEWLDNDPLFGVADVEFDGVVKACHMACVPDAKIGDYVIVHAGIAITLVEEAEAYRIQGELRRLNLTASPATDTNEFASGGDA